LDELACCHHWRAYDATDHQSDKIGGAPEWPAGCVKRAFPIADSIWPNAGEVKDRIPHIHVRFHVPALEPESHIQPEAEWMTSSTSTAAKVPLGKVEPPGGDPMTGICRHAFTACIATCLPIRQPSQSRMAPGADRPAGAKARRISRLRMMAKAPARS
jgi:hypothetical protein